MGERNTHTLADDERFLIWQSMVEYAPEGKRLYSLDRYLDKLPSVADNAKSNKWHESLKQMARLLLRPFLPDFEIKNWALGRNNKKSREISVVAKVTDPDWLGKEDTNARLESASKMKAAVIQRLSKLFKHASERKKEFYFIIVVMNYFTVYVGQQGTEYK